MSAAEQAAFQRAVRHYADRPNSPEPITEMIQLACEAGCPTLRSWAAKWLSETCNVRVVVEQEQEQDCAATPTAGSLL